MENYLDLAFLKMILYQAFQKYRQLVLKGMLIKSIKIATF